MQARSSTPVNKVLKPLQEFLRLEAAGGLILMMTTVLALVVANSPLAAHYKALLDLPLEIRIGTFGIAKLLLLWINDGLMAVFFFLAGMELKREVVEGHLSSPRQASLPAFAAVGGMLAPAALYVAFNWENSVALEGLAIPTATDIAFALGGLSLLGKRVPTALKAFLLSIAIFDYLGAIVVIALFYTAKLSVLSLVIAAVLMLGLASLNRFGVTRPAAYFLLGVPFWVAVLKSGVHATLAGVVLAMSWLAVRLGIASPPEGAGWWQLYGTALLCGIGFRMSLFIASLAFEQGGAAFLGLERLGILIGSLVSGLLGYTVLRISLSGRDSTSGVKT